MTHLLLQGARVGAAVGACLSVAALAVAGVVLKDMLHFATGPLSQDALGLAGLTVALGAALGGSLALVGGARLQARPALLPLGVALPFAGLALGSSGFPLMQAGAVGLGLGLHAALRRVGRSWPRLTAVGCALGVLGLCVAAERPTSTRQDLAPAPAGATSVLVVVWDTVRADHVPPGGYTARDTAPHLRGMAAEGAVFERAYATSTWTLPSHASMLTGTWPGRHGCDDQHPYLDPGQPHLAALLSERGWATALMSSNPWVGRDTGLDRGFGAVVPAWSAALAAKWFPIAALLNRWRGADKGGDEVDRRFADWVRGLPAERPFFALLNYLEAHDPYHELSVRDRRVFVSDAEAPAAARASSAHLRHLFGQAVPPPDSDALEALTALYDAGVRADDRHLGVLLALLRELGRLDRTLVVVVSDHGESLGEHGRLGHHQDPAEEVLRVPLVLRLPGRVPPGVRIAETVSLVDLLPTALDAAGQPDARPEGSPGRSLLALLAGAADPNRRVYAEHVPPTSPMLARRVEAQGLDPATYHWWTVQQGGLRLARGPWGERLYDLDQDPAGELDFSAQHPAAHAALGASLDAFTQPGALPSGPVPTLDPAAQERLRSLGYLP